MELNPTHPILTKMQEEFDADKSSEMLDNYAELLFGYGLLAEGSELQNPVKFTQLVADLMVKGL